MMGHTKSFKKPLYIYRGFPAYGTTGVNTTFIQDGIPEDSLGIVQALWV
jgi:hypothetical protein